MEYSAIIPCGGIGSRLNLGYNKILLKVKDEYLIEKTIKNFLNDCDCKEVIIVYQETDLKSLKDILKHPKIRFTIGGQSREESVYNGLKIAKYECVLIHDGARPNIKVDLIKRIKEKLINNDCVIPIVKSKDATLIDEKYHFNEVSLIQTPQALKKDILLKAMENVDLGKFKDDGSIYAYYYKKDIATVLGDYSNIKVTTIDDLNKIEEE